MSPFGFAFALASGTERGSYSLFLRVTLSHHLADVTADRLAAGAFFKRHIYSFSFDIGATA
jgi:hypothetical protein